MAVAEYAAQIDLSLAGDDDLAGYVRRLELMADDEDDEDDDDEDDDGQAVISDQPGLGLDPGADAGQMVEDIERFLRDQGAS
jgi:hypothetical protein